MKKCPCEECITRPMCSRSESIIKLLEKCQSLAEYTTSRRHILNTAGIIKPFWFRTNDNHNLPDILDNILTIAATKRRYPNAKLPV